MDGEGDYYALLNLEKNCSEDDIKAAYKRFCRMYHPDKHNNVLRGAAETIFHKIQAAYEVLNDPQLRTIYDIYGVEGVENNFNQVALVNLDKNQIKETYERMLRQKREQEEEMATNPVSFVKCELDATGLLNSVESDHISDILSLRVTNFTLRQSVDAPLTDRDRATITAEVENEGGTGGGSIHTTMRHTFSADTWLHSGVGFGNGFVLTGGGFKKLTNLLYVTCDGTCTFNDGYLSYGGSGMIGCNIDDTTSLTLNMNRNSIKPVFQKSWDKLHLYISYKLLLDKQILTMKLIRSLQINDPNDAQVECAMRLSTNGLVFEYGATKQLTEYSRLGAVLSVGNLTGVILNLSLTRGKHNYSIPINLSDIIEPIAIVYGTCLPVTLFASLHFLVVSPYLKRKKEEEAEQKAHDMAVQIQKARDEAKAAVSLMKESYERCLNIEQIRGGLVLVQAWYGVFGTVGRLIDVTIPLQCLISDSKLILSDQSKAGLVGFYDPCLGEDKKLSVTYRFRNVTHEVTIGDQEPLKIPRQSHRVS